MIQFDIITVFPEIITSYCNESIIGRAQKQSQVIINAHNLRNWTTDKHHTVDDRVFGGGPGMLMKVEPLYNAIKEIKDKNSAGGFTSIVIATAASGELFSQTKAQQMALPAENTAYIIICGRYEGFDARVLEFVDVSLAIGPYVLTGGELGALTMLDAITRLIPGVLGNEDSAKLETTFEIENGKILVDGEHPQFTSPAEWTFTDPVLGEQKRIVPEVLRSGNHGKILSENNSQRIKRTY